MLSLGTSKIPNCFVSKRGQTQVKESPGYISDIQVTLSLAMISSMIIERDYRIDIPIHSVTSKSTTGTQINIPKKRYCYCFCVCVKMLPLSEN